MSRRSSVVSESGALTMNDAEKGPAANQPNAPQPFSHLWHHEEIRGHRTGFVRAIVGGLVVTMVAVLAILSIYWGAFWKSPYHAHNLKVVVVDLDGSTIGKGIQSLFTSPSVTGASTQLSYCIASSGEFSSAADVESYIINEHAWAAVVVTSGATQTLQAAIAAADTSYNASNAIVLYYATARNENTPSRFILPQVPVALERFAEQFAATNAASLANSGSLSTLLSTAPTLVTRPVSYHNQDLRPFDIPVAAAVDFVGLIYLLVISFVVAMMNYSIRQMTGLNTFLHIRHLLILRFVVPFTLYFFMSWIYSFVSLAFQVNFSRYYGNGGFVLYWICSFLGMAALGLAVESVITILGPQFVPYFLLLWIISNVSVAFFPIPVLPGVFRYGYAMPFYNVGQIVRTLLFDTKNHLGRNYGILVAWVALSCFTMTVFTLIMRRKEVAAHRAKTAPTSPA